MMLRFTLSKFQSFLLMPGFMKTDTITQQYNYNTTYKGADHKGQILVKYVLKNQRKSTVTWLSSTTVLEKKNWFEKEDVKWV